MGYNNKKYAKGRDILVPAIEINKTYIRGADITHALKGITIEIFRGELVCIMGPSGSGKSTLFNMFGGLDSPTSGRIFIDEVNMASLTAKELAFLRNRKIAYIFQSYNLNSVMTALENVTMHMIFGGMHPDKARKRGMALLGKVGLGDRWRHRLKEMSGGQQQRVAIARALANNPSLLLCDEPTANLDLKTGHDIHKILEDLNKIDKVTIICATHDVDMLVFSDRMVWLDDGKVARIELSKDVRLQKGSLGIDFDE